MKTLEFLKDVRNDTSCEWLELDEAIKELEELQNRSCNYCEYNKRQEKYMIFCDAEMCEDGSKMMWHSFTKDFCCNHYKANGKNI